MGEVRRRVEDRRVLALVRAFLKAGVMSETGGRQRTVSGTPQGGIASPLLANIALSALDRRYAADWQEMTSYASKTHYLRSKGHPTYRLVRYADDFVVVVNGSREQAQALLTELDQRVRSLGLNLKPEKTGITHIDDGFVFLGMKIMRKTRAGRRARRSRRRTARYGARVIAARAWRPALAGQDH